jgi:transcriptional regulator with XRE-family HTH domain
MAKKSDDADAPHPLDVALGARVRQRRRELGLSQDDLARATGITFQQVQKYEHGANRISFSRLVEIAQALDLNVAGLIGDLDELKSSGALERPTALLSEPGASDLLEAYVAIDAPKRRRALVHFARQLAGDGDGAGAHKTSRR